MKNAIKIKFNEGFIISNATLCLRVNNNNCLYDYKFMPVPLESEKYKNLRCSSKIIKSGFKCCSESIKVDHTDNLGSWGYENNELCGIPFDTLDIKDDNN